MAVDAVDPDDSMLAQAEANVAEAAERIAAGRWRAATRARRLRRARGARTRPGRRADLHRQRAAARRGPRGAARGARRLQRGAQARGRPGAAPAQPRASARTASRGSSRRSSARSPEGTRVFLRVIDYPAAGEFLDFDFVTLTRDADGVWDVASRRSPHTALPLELLRDRAVRCRLRAHRGVRRTRRAPVRRRQGRERHRGRSARRLATDTRRPRPHREARSARLGYQLRPQPARAPERGVARGDR